MFYLCIIQATSQISLKYILKRGGINISSHIPHGYIKNMSKNMGGSVSSWWAIPSHHPFRTMGFFLTETIQRAWGTPMTRETAISTIHFPHPKINICCFWGYVFFSAIAWILPVKPTVISPRKAPLMLRGSWKEPTRHRMTSHSTMKPGKKYGEIWAKFSFHSFIPPYFFRSS